MAEWRTVCRVVKRSGARSAVHGRDHGGIRRAVALERTMLFVLSGRVGNPGEARPLAVEVQGRDGIDLKLRSG